MYPGRARLVSTPSSNSIRDVFTAVADALGMTFAPNVRTPVLRDEIQYVIRHSGLFLVWDESHFLLPATYGRNTAPARLDWLRTQIIDKKLPVALVCTPQAFKHGVEKFQRHTGYNFAQFFGRVMLNVTLPNELSDEDLQAVVRIQGPDIPEKFHLFIVARACQSEGYLKTIEAICRRARFIARRDNHPTITQADVELAESEVNPSAPAPVVATPLPRLQSPVAIKRGRMAAPSLQAPAPRQTSPAPQSPLEMPARETTPAFQPV
jgi:hypothetical protein